METENKNEQRAEHKRDYGNVVISGIAVPEQVCHGWLQVLSLRSFWISYTKRRHILNTTTFAQKPLLELKMEAALGAVFSRNLISNPSGEDGYSGWKITKNGGDKFVIENPPVFCATDENIETAFACSYGFCRKHYVVDLWANGITEKFMEVCHPAIKVSEFYNCRRDCASRYCFCVLLLESDDHTERALQGGPFTEVVIGDITAPHFFCRTREMEQWTAAEWQYIEHTFTDYSPHIRYVVFEHGGRDSQFWAGHFGPKMSKASVSIILNCSCSTSTVGNSCGVRCTVPFNGDTGRNLIKNPSGELGLFGWTRSPTGSDDDRLWIEFSPVDCPVDLNVPVAFSTSRWYCAEYYVIDLWRNGFQESFLDGRRPPITVSESYNSHSNNASTYFLHVVLLTSEETPAQMVLGENYEDLGEELEERTTNKSILRTRRLDLGRDPIWQHVEHTFTDYPPGIRYVMFEHGGNCREHLRGNRGPKMAKAYVSVDSA